MTADGRSRPDLAAYYADTRLMWRNVILIMLGYMAWSIVSTILNPLNTKKMIALGLDESTNALLGSINSWAISILVMYFSFKSDRTDTRLGRRLPYLLISTPFIAVSALGIPFVNTLGATIVLSLIGMFFGDMKASTYPLLSIDCVRRDVLARVNSINGIIGGVIGFIALRWGIGLAKFHPLLPYGLSAALILVITAVVLMGVKEPPTRVKDGAKFRLWSTFQVAARDRRMMLLMLGVALLNCVGIVSYTWLTFYVLKVLNVSAADYGKIVSWSSIVGILLAYPAGYLIDRVSGYRIILLYWAMQVMLGLSLIFLVRIWTLPYLFVWSAVAGCLCTGPTIMIWKSCPPDHVGSYTATVAFFTNAVSGTVLFLSGRVLAWSGNNYACVYVFGIVGATAGFILILVYRHLMLNGPRQLTTREAAPDAVARCTAPASAPAAN
jgi:MFS family permease